ncbi:MAG: hypothetical protein LUI14_10840 [Lachnospiraceae bacterium]|nr:hypothetical protein [Lachnospiraceae bacterium]
MNASYENCYVAFLDILGFKEMVKRKDKNILSVFEKLSDKEQLFTALEKSNCNACTEYSTTLIHVCFHVMSDSVVISVPSNKPYALEIIIRACLYLQCQLYAVGKVNAITKDHKHDIEGEPVLLRGAIACGEFYQKDSIAFGPALVDAYVCQENYAKYPRIIVSKELVESVGDRISLYELLYFDESDRYFYIDCMKEYFEKSDPYIPEIKRFAKFINRHLDFYEPLSIREKYIWLSNDFRRINGNTIFTGNETIEL